MRGFPFNTISGCLNQLMQDNEVDWVREEILCAKKHEKNIVPILIGTTTMPHNKDIMPESLRFLSDLDAIFLPEQYISSPFESFLKTLTSLPKKDKFMYTANGNEEYDVRSDFLKTLEKVVGPNTSLRVSRFRGTRPQSLIALTGRGSYYSLFTGLDTNL